jgi:hypothetical protein
MTDIIDKRDTVRSIPGKWPTVAEQIVGKAALDAHNLANQALVVADENVLIAFRALMQDHNSITSATFDAAIDASDAASDMWDATWDVAINTRYWRWLIG